MKFVEGIFHLLYGELMNAHVLWAAENVLILGEE